MVLVTGASSGIGWATCEVLALQGAVQALQLQPLPPLPPPPPLLLLDKMHGPCTTPSSTAPPLPAAAGMRVVAVARRKEKLEALQVHMHSMHIPPTHFLPVVCDITKDAEVRSGARLQLGFAPPPWPLATHRAHVQAAHACTQPL